LGSPASQPGRVPEVANLGLARPPLVTLAAIGLGLALHAVWPLPLAPRAVGAPLGFAVVAVAVVTFAAALRTLRAAGTPIPGNRPTTVIVRGGPYRFSRNPIYLSFALVQLGIALWVGSAWLLATLVGSVALLSLVVIPREERYLAARFPSEYPAYAARVRRWL
jgi:protein-S-isoprenylcysteine O-methyltransferase Ste14